MITQAYRDTLTTPLAQDIHITCPPDLMEQLVAEFEQQFTDRPDVEVYDYGWSSRFHTGYIVLSWKEGVDPAFEAQLNADDRLQGHSISDLPIEQPLYIAVEGRESVANL